MRQRARFPGGICRNSLSGARLPPSPSCIIIAQPTWGVDVGAAAQIHAEILALRDAGCAVLIVSEELDELFELSDRLYVLAKGHLSPSVARADATVQQVGEWMSGLWNADVQQHLADMEHALPSSEAAQANAQVKGPQHV